MSTRRKRAEAEPAALEAVSEVARRRAAAVAEARRRLEEVQAEGNAALVEAIGQARSSGHPMRAIAAAAGLGREHLYALIDKQRPNSGD